MNQARAATSAPGIGRVVEVVDRSFPLLWIGFYLLLPVSGWATVMFESWFDQQRDLEALQSVLDVGRADAIADSVIGPAYIAAAALLHYVFGLSPEDSLVALTRGSYALSAAAGMVLVRALLRGLVSVPPFASLAAQLAFGCARLLGRDLALVGCSMEPLLRSLPRRDALRGPVCAIASDGRSRRCDRGRVGHAGSYEELRASRTHPGVGRRVCRARGVASLGPEDLARSASGYGCRRIRRDNGRRLPGYRKARCVLPLRQPSRSPVRQRAHRRDRRDTDLQLRARAHEARAAVRRALLLLDVPGLGLRGWCKSVAGAARRGGRERAAMATTARGAAPLARLAALLCARDHRPSGLVCQAPSDCLGAGARAPPGRRDDGCRDGHRAGLCGEHADRVESSPVRLCPRFPPASPSHRRRRCWPDLRRRCGSFFRSSVETPVFRPSLRSSFSPSWDLQGSSPGLRTRVLTASRGSRAGSSGQSPTRHVAVPRRVTCRSRRRPSRDARSRFLKRRL